MSFSMIAAFTVFIASIFLSQRLAINAGQRLDDPTKLKIFEVFPKRNSNYTLIVFAIVATSLIAIYSLPQYSLQITVIYAVVFAIYLFTKLYLNVRKLREISAPESYVRSIVASFAVFIVGAVVAAGVFAGAGGRGY